MGNYTEEEIENKTKDFDKKFGNGRHRYIFIPTNLAELFLFEFDIDLEFPTKSLGEIVDLLQKK